MTDIVVRHWFLEQLRALFTTMGVLDDHIAWPGKRFIPQDIPEADDWWRVAFIIPESRTNALGRNAWNRIRGGILQVDLFVPTAGDTDDMMAIQSTMPICDAFRKGVQYDDPALFNVSCRQSFIAHSGRDSASERWQVSVRVRFDADIIN